ncbi:MAG: polysaccharide deacetylase family protein [bacterium]
MYHRVCPLDANSACYFARGTAVQPATFAAHIDHMRRRLRAVSLGEALTGAEDGPTFALTFDDGYRDVLDFVEPICQARKLAIALFPVARNSGRSRSALWFDRYYELLHRARRRHGLAPGSLGLVTEESVPSIDGDLLWWVRGPLKQRLAALDAAGFDAALDGLRSALMSSSDDELAAHLYLSDDELRWLCREGALVGGHGAAHRRLDRMSADAALSEMRQSAALLDAIGTTGPRVFCYPDGGVPADAADMLSATGFEFGLTVAAGTWHRRGDRARVPRFLVRESTTATELDGFADSVVSMD